MSYILTDDISRPFSAEFGHDSPLQRKLGNPIPSDLNENIPAIFTTDCQQSTVLRDDNEIKSEYEFLKRDQEGRRETKASPQMHHHHAQT